MILMFILKFFMLITNFNKGKVIPSNRTKIDKLNVIIGCKLVEEIFWKQQGCCVTQISYIREWSVFQSGTYCIQIKALYFSSTHLHP